MYPSHLQWYLWSFVQGILAYNHQGWMLIHSYVLQHKQEGIELQISYREPLFQIHGALYDSN
jgi:hypothetical protein